MRQHRTQHHVLAGSKAINPTAPTNENPTTQSAPAKLATIERVVKATAARRPAEKSAGWFLGKKPAQKRIC
jgi:hypothetical protein